jgi:hypothetical protein
MAKSSTGSTLLKVGLWIVGIYAALWLYSQWKNSSSSSTSSASSTGGSVTSVGAGAPTNSLVPNAGTNAVSGSSTLANSFIPTAGPIATPILRGPLSFGGGNSGNGSTGFNDGYRNGGAWGVATPIVRFTGLRGF